MKKKNETMIMILLRSHLARVFFLSFFPDSVYFSDVSKVKQGLQMALTLSCPRYLVAAGINFL